VYDIILLFSQLFILYESPYMRLNNLRWLRSRSNLAWWTGWNLAFCMIFLIHPGQLVHRLDKLRSSKLHGPMLILSDVLESLHALTQQYSGDRTFCLAKRLVLHALINLLYKFSVVSEQISCLSHCFWKAGCKLSMRPHPYNKKTKHAHSKD
jgi:hypothetical protein